MQRTLIRLTCLTCLPVLVAASAGAQQLPATGASADLAGRWELGMYPTVRKLTHDIAPQHVWGGGFTATAGYRLASLVSVEAALSGGWIPQLNMIDQGALNALSPSLSLVLESPSSRAVRPYLLVGAAYESFRFREPMYPGAKSLSFGAGHAGAGVRVPLAHNAALRAEMNTQVGSQRPSWGFFTGVAYYPGARRPAPQVVERVARVTDTLRVVDTVRVRDTVVVTNSVQVRDTVVVAKVTEGEEVILVLKDANFDFAKALLRPEALPALDSLAARLTVGSGRGIRIAIAGYTDAVGSEAANYRLGLARATSVRDYLAGRGVESARVTVSSRGEADPVASNATEAGRQLNRRVVIRRVP